MVSRIANSSQLRQLLKQGLLNPTLQRLVNSGTTLTTTAKLQNRKHVFSDFNQADLTPMCRQRRIHLG